MFEKFMNEYEWLFDSPWRITALVILSGFVLLGVREALAGSGLLSGVRWLLVRSRLLAPRRQRRARSTSAPEGPRGLTGKQLAREIKRVSQ